MSAKCIMFGLLLMVAVSVAQDCSNDEYRSPNSGECEARKIEGQYCNVVQLCHSAFTCEQARCTNVCESIARTARMFEQYFFDATRPDSAVSDPILSMVHSETNVNVATKRAGGDDEKIGGTGSDAMVQLLSHLQSEYGSSSTPKPTVFAPVADCRDLQYFFVKFSHESAVTSFQIDLGAHLNGTQTRFLLRHRYIHNVHSEVGSSLINGKV